MEDRIAPLIAAYKNHIKETRLSDELYKWRLVEKFKGRPDINVADFRSEILELNYQNLIYQIARSVMQHLGRERPEPFRDALRGLFNEDLPLFQRINDFQSAVLRIYRSIGESMGTHHDERTISALLAVKYPEKYSFYKDSFYRKFCELQGISPKKKNEKFGHYTELIDRFIEEYIVEDLELLELVNGYMTEDCYPDENHRILAQDILYQLLDKTSDESAVDGIQGPRYWLYSPGRQAGQWDEFYEEGIIGLGWNELGDLRQYKSQKEIATALQEIEATDSAKYNDARANFEFLSVMSVGDIVIPKRGRTAYLGYGIVTSDYEFDSERPAFKSLRRVEWKRKGEWAADFPLSVKTLTDLTKYPDYVIQLKKLIGIEGADTEIESEVEVNLRSHSLNTILYGPPGTGKTYNSIEKAVAITDRSVFVTHAERKTAFDRLRAEGQIEFVTFHQNYSYEDFVVGIRPDVESSELRFLPQKGIFYRIARRARENYEASLSGELSKRPFDEVFEELIERPLAEGRQVPIKMASGQFLKITDLTDSSISFDKPTGTYKHTLSITTLQDVFEGKREIPRGMGSYYKPVIDLFMINAKVRRPAVTRKNFVLVIDEINRANISRVFGELITLLEDDKRLGAENELRVTLPNGEKDFGVPPNLFLIGTMNTADKSIALIDIALRRRFEFEGYYPQYQLIDDEMGEVLEHINRKIYESKKSADYLIGHAYFMKKEPIEKVLQGKVVPLLMEYFAGKTNLIQEMFVGSGWVVRFDQTSWSWDISRETNAVI